jgi:hypothetical protein
MWVSLYTLGEGVVTDAATDAVDNADNPQEDAADSRDQDVLVELRLLRQEVKDLKDLMVKK